MGTLLDFIWEIVASQARLVILSVLFSFACCWPQAYAGSAGDVLKVTCLEGKVVENDSLPCVSAGTAFGNQKIEGTVSKKFVIENISAKKINLSGYRKKGSRRFQVRYEAGLLDSGERKFVQVMYQPKEKTAESGELHLYAGDLDPFVLRFSGSSFDIKPAKGSLKGGTQIRISGDVPQKGEISGVRVGENDAEFKVGGGLFSIFRRGPDPINITIPASVESGLVDITLCIVGQESVILPSVYTYE